MPETRFSNALRFYEYLLIGVVVVSILSVVALLQVQDRRLQATIIKGDEYHEESIHASLEVRNELYRIRGYIFSHASGELSDPLESSGGLFEVDETFRLSSSVYLIKQGMEHLQVIQGEYGEREFAGVLTKAERELEHFFGLSQAVLDQEATDNRALFASIGPLMDTNEQIHRLHVAANRRLNSEIIDQRTRGYLILVVTVGAALMTGVFSIRKVLGMLREAMTSRAEAEESARLLEKQMVESQRLESLGVLAGGIAHDFNNILHIIFSYTDLVLSDLSEDDAAVKSLAVIRDTATRGSDLTKQILMFSRGTTGDREPLYLVPILIEAIDLMRATLPTSIDFRMDIMGEDIVIVTNPTEVHQIVINLFTNASHSMEESGGELYVELKKRDLGESDVAENPLLKPGSYGVLRVEDIGIGMDEETLAQIYTPFFTTKHTGEGTGLGLSVVYGIVRSYGGDVEISSIPGEGTTVVVYIPLSEQDVDGSGSEPDVRIAGSEHILLVDDEPAIVQSAGVALTRLGYRVTSTTSSEEALSIFESSPFEFDLILTDYTMPGMNGLQLAEKIKSIREDISVLLLSGNLELIDRGSLEDIVEGGIAKPIRFKELAAEIRKILVRA